MSILNWLVVAVIAYFVHNTYQRIQHSRKKAEFIRDRRRAAGIPDDDDRPFAVARVDALSRRAQQKRQEHLSTPVKRRTLAPSRSQTNIDHEAAARLSGIPGTLPGYLKHRVSNDAGLTTSQHRRYEASQTIASSSPRSPSPNKRQSLERNSSQKSKTRQDSQYKLDHAPQASRSPVKNDVEGSPSAHRNLKRRQQASPTKSEVGSGRSKAQKVSIPGTFGADQAIEDEEMSDATHSAAEDISEAMEEDEDVQVSHSHPRPLSANTNKAKPARQNQLQTLQTAARATAKKREADELDGSDTEQSIASSDDEEHIQSQPHSSKRSRTVNKDLDPSSSLDFDIALPEEAMTDFIPVHHDTSSAQQTKLKGTTSQTKRQADTSDDRQPGEEWTDFEGLRWRIHPDTQELQRWSDVLEWRSKYRMPRDSLHPMAKESHQVVVHKWLTKDEWEEAKSKRLLSFQEPERLAEKERSDKEEAEKMRRKQELLAKIRQTSSPNKRIQSYLVQQQRRQLQHKLSRGELSGDVSMDSFVTNDTDGDRVSMSLDSSSVVGGAEGTPSKPRSRRISLQSSARMTPARGEAGATVGNGREGKSTSGASSPSDGLNRRRGSPLASPYRPIAYPKGRKGTPANSSPLVTSTFPPPDGSSS
ncbi:uncharacterized protein UTRI_00400_B [Ustilago trichophora]|uniref:Uncharacterized protein n=1 Tax=Ustilago trichophora TaxID=86804 RepID=A0A5C3DPE6_9BASI|nr:uncharacterized protein UTRI_00400_B [Ustilago trichophora]